MFLKILRERHRFEHYLLVKHRGIKQMEPIVLPDGQAEVSDIEPFLLTGDGDDVAVAHSLAQQTAVRDDRLGDIAELATRNALLHPTDIADVFGVFAQSLITIGVRTHVVDVDRLERLERRVRRLNLRHDPLGLVSRNPLGEVMDAAGVAVGYTLPIAHIPKGIEVSLPGILAAIGTEREGRDILNERGAVELARIHDQSLAAIRLECVGHIGNPQELAGKEQREVRGARLLAGLSEQSADGRTISRQGTHGTLRIGCTHTKAGPPPYGYE